MADEGGALTSDLKLRSIFPFLQTRLFETIDGNYVIVFEKSLLDATAFSETFHHSIRPVTARVQISNSAPNDYKREISPILDTEISKDFTALFVTEADVVNLLAIRFPGIDLARVDTIRGGVVEIVVRKQLEPELEAAVLAFMNGFKTHETFIRVDTAAPQMVWKGHHSSWHITASKLRPSAPQFVRDDERFWFENLDDLYRGQYTFQSVPGAEDIGSACLIDFTTGQNQINIRQALLYYDTVIVTPPFSDSKSGWETQRLSDADCVKLVEAGRLKFLLAHQEERVDIKLLEAAYELDQSSLIGRRSAAAIILADIVKTTQEYRFCQPDFLPATKELGTKVAEIVEWPLEQAYEFILWPISALRQSLYPLLNNGAVGVGAIGQDRILAESFKKSTGKDRALEMMMPGYATHLAHALNATYIPSLDEPANWIWIYRTIGDRLNFYRSFNTRIAAAWVGNEDRKRERRVVIPPLPLFEFDADTPIEEFIEATALGSLRRKGRALLTRLADMPVDERPNEVGRLIARARGLKGRESGLFSLETLEDAGPITELVAGHAVPPYFAMRNLLNRIMNLRGKSSSFDMILDVIEQEINPLVKRNEDLDFLSKVDRVAQLRRQRYS